MRRVELFELIRRDHDQDVQAGARPQIPQRAAITPPSRRRARWPGRVLATETGTGHQGGASFPLDWLVKQEDASRFPWVCDVDECRYDSGIGQP